jgi:hypothetical protein
MVISDSMQIDIGRRNFLQTTGWEITGMNPKANFGNIPQQAAAYHTLRFAGLFPLGDNLTSKLQGTLFLKFGSHYNLPIPMRYAFGIGVSHIHSLFLYCPLCYHLRTITLPNGEHETLLTGKEKALPYK